MKKFSEIDSEHYSKYTLRRFAAVVNTGAVFFCKSTRRCINSGNA
ncbi:Uncharacterised protein [Klebsiella pneumoniae]|nr:Uncharacterised protein [Klebsiella pneumoniae]